MREKDADWGMSCVRVVEVAGEGEGEDVTAVTDQPCVGSRAVVVWSAGQGVGRRKCRVVAARCRAGCVDVAGTSDVDCRSSTRHRTGCARVSFSSV